MSSSSITPILLSLICVSHNPRRPARNLQNHLIEEGFFTVKDGENVALKPLDLVHNLALSENPENRQKFVELMEKYEGGTKQIVELANSRIEDELQPIILRSYRVKNNNGDGYEERYGIAAGERRTLAAAYNYAKHGTKPEIGAIVQKLTVAEAYDLAIIENAHRADPTELEDGEMYHNYRGQTNPATGKNYTLKEIAAKFNLDYQTVRGREALAYLSDKDKSRLEDGKIGLTVAIAAGLAIKQGKDNEIEDRKPTRDRALNLTQVQKLFDESRNKANAYLQALADVMQIDLETAMKQSDRRIKSQAE